MNILSCFPFKIKWDHQFSSVSQSCPTLYDPMDHSTPGLPVHHQLLEFAQTYVYRVGDAIQPSHPLSSPSPPALNLSHHQVFSWRGTIPWPERQLLLSGNFSSHACYWVKAGAHFREADGSASNRGKGNDPSPIMCHRIWVRCFLSLGLLIGQEQMMNGKKSY